MKINSINSQYQNRNLSNRGQQKQSVNTAPSFKGGMLPEPVMNSFSNFYGKLAGSKPFQKFVNNFSKSNNTFTHLLIAESCFLSGFYMLNTLRNKKIKKEQKPQMLINDALTLGVSSAGAYFVEDKITNLVKKGSESYFKKHSDFYTQLGQKAQEKLAVSPKTELLNKVAEVAVAGGEKLKEGIDDVASLMKGHLKNIVTEEGKEKAFQISANKMEAIKGRVAEAVKTNVGDATKAKEAVKGLVDDVYSKSAARVEADKTFAGINKLKVLVIFGIIYRYLGPVVITPVANKISSKLFKNKAENQQNKTVTKPETKPQEKK